MGVNVTFLVHINLKDKQQSNDWHGNLITTKQCLTWRI